MEFRSFFTKVAALTNLPLDIIVCGESHTYEDGTVYTIPAGTTELLLAGGAAACMPQPGYKVNNVLIDPELMAEFGYDEQIQKFIIAHEVGHLIGRKNDEIARQGGKLMGMRTEIEEAIVEAEADIIAGHYLGISLDETLKIRLKLMSYVYPILEAKHPEIYKQSQIAKDIVEKALNLQCEYIVKMWNEYGDIRAA